MVLRWVWALCIESKGGGLVLGYEPGGAMRGVGCKWSALGPAEGGPDGVESRGGGLPSPGVTIFFFSG